MKLQTVRGTRDLYGDEARLFREIDQGFARLARLYDFQEMMTPIFEFTSVFKRTLGEASDIVTKEMYTFEDRGGDSLTLRPEGTASVARAVISNSMLRDLPLKFFYSGPMFRHERPQKGRYRQFSQFGVELIGIDKPMADIEVLALAQQFFKEFGLIDKVQLELNTIGDSASRQAYQDKLIAYLTPFKSELSEDSQTRLEKNPLRILDSKDEGDKKITSTAPQFSDSLNPESQQFFRDVTNGLDQLDIPFKINQQLVRGLDYYNHTVFEFTTNALGSQNAVLSGGRYDNLIATMGGPSTPGVGWAAGTDRLALLLEQPSEKFSTVAIISTDEIGDKEVLPLLNLLRENHIAAQPIYSGNVSKKMKKANNRNCAWSLIIGEAEQQKNIVVLKDLKSGEQKEVHREKMIQFLKDHQ